MLCIQSLPLHRRQEVHCPQAVARNLLHSANRGCKSSTNTTCTHNLPALLLHIQPSWAGECSGAPGPAAVLSVAKCPAGCHACFQVCQAGRHAALLACPSCNDLCSNLLASSRVTPGFCIANLQRTSLVSYLSGLAQLEQPLGTSGPAGYCHVSLTAASLAVIESALRSITYITVDSWLSDGTIAIVRSMHLQWNIHMKLSLGPYLALLDNSKLQFSMQNTAVQWAGDWGNLFRENFQS